MGADGTCDNAPSACRDRLGQSHRSATVAPMSGLPNTAHFCDCSSAAGLVSFGYPDYKSNAGP